MLRNVTRSRMLYSTSQSGAGYRCWVSVAACRSFSRFAVPLRRVEGHVAQRQIIRINGEQEEVNSYHRFAAFESRPPLDVWAVADDGVVKAIRHSAQPMTGIMWHPERCSPFRQADVQLFRQVFGV